MKYYVLTLLLLILNIIICQEEPEVEEDPERGSFDWLGTLLVSIFYLFVLWVGIWSSRKQKDTTPEEMLLAGRNLGGFVGVLTLLSTWYCAGTIYSNAEMVSSAGILNTQSVGCYAICFWVGAIFFVEKLRSGNYLTMLDPFQYKFGPKLTSLLYLPEVLADVCWIGSTFSALGSCLSTLIGIPPWLGVTVSAVFSAIYTFFGGMYAVAYTDVVQFIVLFVCLWGCVPFVYTSPLVGKVSDFKDVWIGSIEMKYFGDYLDTTIMLICGSIPVQIYVQRILSVRSAKDAKTISIWCGIGNIVCDTATVLLAIAAASADWSKTPIKTLVGHHAHTMTYILKYLVPKAVSYIGLGAISAATMSTADSLLLAASGMFTMNIYQPFLRPKASPREITIATKLSVIVVTIIGIVLALTAKSLYELLLLSSDFVFILLFPQFILVLWYPKYNSYGCLFSYIISLFFRAGAGIEVFGIPTFINYPSGVPYKTIIVFIAIIIAVLLSELSHYFIITKGKLNYDFLHQYVNGDVNEEVQSYPNNEEDEIDKDKKRLALGAQTIVEVPMENTQLSSNNNLPFNNNNNNSIDDKEN
uniref:High affinity choline transporter 1 n=1 Tax=Opalinidae sp. TaxID=2059444 RepID=A0A649UYV7_9STRA|nr:high affinity choline transporter 1 [Opalinidae sp.]